jgi:hypothetical protein
LVEEAPAGHMCRPGGDRIVLVLGLVLMDLEGQFLPRVHERSSDIIAWLYALIFLSSPFPNRPTPRTSTVPATKVVTQVLEHLIYVQVHLHVSLATSSIFPYIFSSSLL